MENNIQSFYSNGKILLTGEYLVLKGAKALALPVNLGQKMEIAPNSTQELNWITFEKNKPVFTVSFNKSNFSIIETSDHSKAKYIANILESAKKLNPNFLSDSNGFDVKSSIQFNMNWGLGTSSTLISNIAIWAGIDPFELNGCISDGSGYDIACARRESPIIYKKNDNDISIEEIDFKPTFIYELNLLYLNKKVSTDHSISKVLSKLQNVESVVEEMNELTLSFANCQSLSVFMQLMTEHEQLVSKTINMETIKSLHFSDFNGEVKSLGAWGGDFALVASPLTDMEQHEYFSNKGFPIFFPLMNLLMFK